MSRITLRSAALILVAALLPSRGQAQIHLGGLIHTATKVVGIHFDSIVVELTPSRIDAALKAFAAEQDAGPGLSAAYQQKEAGYQQSLRDWRGRDSSRAAANVQYNQCMSGAMGGGAGLSLGGSAGGGAVSGGSGSYTVSGTGPTMSANLNDPAVRAHINSLKARLQAAGTAQDLSLSLALADSLRQALGYNQGSQTVTYSGTPGSATTTGASVGASASLSMPQAQAKCGYTQNQANSQAAASDLQPQPPVLPHDSLASLAAHAGGFTVAQYAMIRERILGFLSIDFDKINNGTTRYAFSAREAIALQSKRAQLTTYQRMLATQ